MSTPSEHLGEMQQIIHWMNLDGHLREAEANEVMNEIEGKIHKARKVFERLEKEKQNGRN